jgi:hypothetical protein
MARPTSTCHNGMAPGFLRTRRFRTTIAIMKYGIALVAVALLLTGCLSVDTTIALNRDGSGRLDIVYEIDSDLYDLGVFDDTDNALPIPISRDQFRETADRIPGLRLRRYGIHEEVGTVTVTARLQFDSVEALNAWYGGETSAITVTESGGESTWSQLLYPGGGSQDTIGTALGESLDGYRLTYRLEPPSDVISAGIGQVIDGGRSAIVEVSLSEIVAARTPMHWKVSW